MSSRVELYVLSWGIYPRRVLLYLAEKGLDSCPAIKITSCSINNKGMMEAPGKPPGSVPILRLPDGTFIKQSVAILEYLEDVCDNPDPTKEWQLQIANAARDRGRGSMRGETVQEVARTREILALADEASTLFGFACHKGSALFVPIEQTSALAAKLVLEYCRKDLKILEDNYFAEQTSLAENGGRASIAHCVLYSLLHFSRKLYGIDLLSGPELPALRTFYESFKERDVGRVGEMQYPQEIAKLARQWLPVE